MMSFDIHSSSTLVNHVLFALSHKSSAHKQCVAQLSLDDTAVEHFRRVHPQVSPQQARSALGGFGVVGDLAIR